ncbi:MAG: hypothetical protein ABIZ91_05840 [Gemmatimonadaceae bacterium]
MTNPNDKRPSDDPDSDEMYGQRPSRSPDENYEGEGKPGSGRPDEQDEDSDDLSDGSDTEEL